MTTIWISFRIAKKDASGKTYQQRYDALVDAVKEISDTFWEETTSFIIFETDTDFNVAASLFKTKISPACDLFLMRKMDSKKAAICGKNDDQDVYDMMPYLDIL